VSTKTRKPNRQELLKELESIRASLLPENTPSGEAPAAAPTKPPKTNSLIAYDNDFVHDDYTLDLSGIIQKEDTVTDIQVPNQTEANPAASKPQSKTKDVNTSVAPAASTPKNAPASTEQDASQRDNQDPMTSALPGQQSLFDSSDGEEAPSPSPKSPETSTISEAPALSADDSAIAKENPFLPKHVKDRLEKERSLYQKEMDAAAKYQTPAKPSSSDNALIDELVKLYLPKIEADLRRRLKQSLNEQQDIQDPA